MRPVWQFDGRTEMRQVHSAVLAEAGVGAHSPGASVDRGHRWAPLACKGVPWGTP